MSDDGELGAFRFVTVMETYPEPVGVRPELRFVWCPSATPGCSTCQDRGEWVGEEDVEPCPGCEGVTPDYDATKDGAHDPIE